MRTILISSIIFKTIMATEHTTIIACRICLDTKYTDGVSFDDEGDWLNMYEYCFGVTISSQDTSRKLCGFCGKKMEDFAKFKTQCLKSHELWKTIILTNPKYNAESYQINSEKNLIKEENDVDYYEKYIDLDDTSENFDYNFDKSNISGSEDIKEETRDVIANDREKKINRINSTFTKRNSKVENPEEKGNKNLQKLYKCKSCRANFRYKKSYGKHIAEKKCNQKKRTRSEKFKWKQSMTKTISSIHLKPTDFFCGLCEEKSPNVEDMKKHLDEHSSINDLSCKLCEYTGTDFSDMEIHRYIHQPNQGRQLRCHICDKKHYTTFSLQYHYRSVHLNKPGGLCTTCNIQYTSYKSWLNHVRGHGNKRFLCDYCERGYLYKSELEAHITDHLDYKGFVCDVCGKAFKRRSNLKLHIEQVHDTKKVTCTHCNKTFKNEKNLKFHLSREAKEKKFQCEVCSKCYPTPNMLKKHMIWHKDDRPFACNVCGSAYKAKSQLKIHVRNHTGDMPYKCTQCPRAFPSLNQLKVHLNVHTGIRKYKCPYCDKTFHNKKNVVMHCSKRHNVSDVIVESSKKSVINKNEGLVNSTTCS